ncbi:MAG: IS21 family transposase, partial [Acidimicrobiia bacterium]
MKETDKSDKLSAPQQSGVEGGVISQEKWGVVRTLRQQGKAKRAIARELGVDIKTVRKWLSTEWIPQKRSRAKEKMEQWKGFIDGRGPEVGFNGAVLFRELRGLGYRGGYSTMARYLKPLRKSWREPEEPTLRFETEPGKQAQVDWGEATVWIGGQKMKVHLFTKVLGYSRRTFARGYRHERIEALLDGHAAAFAHFGGRTETILYDNPRTIVKRKDEATGEVEWNATFKDRMDFYGVEPKLCRFYRAQTKGKVESGVKYVKRNALAGKQFDSLEQMNEYLLEWCVKVADQRIHGTTHERPAERFARAEQDSMIPVEGRVPAATMKVVTRRVPRDAFVAVESNRYPVPFSWVGKELEVEIRHEQIVFRCTGEEPLIHTRLCGTH